MPNIKPEELQSIADYISQRPYREVFGLVSMLQRIADQKPEEKKEAETDGKA